MKLQFQADADFNNSAVVAVKRRWPLIDIRSAARLIPDGLPDVNILELAANQDRVLLTHDVSTMPIHFERFIVGRQSPGIILVRQTRSLASIIEGIYLVGSEWTTEDLRNSVRWLPR